MAWLAVNKNGTEYIFHRRPNRMPEKYWQDTHTYAYIRGITTNASDYSIRLPKGTIEKLIGRQLTWEDNPVKINVCY